MMRKLSAALAALVLCACFSRVAAFAAEHVCCQPQSAPSITECYPEAALHGAAFSAPAPAVLAAAPAPPGPFQLSAPVPDSGAPPGPQSLLSAAPARAPPLA